MSKVISLTSANFKEEVEDYKGKVLIDFWAEWCGPCQMMLPILSDFADKYGDKVKVCKVNVDEAADLAGAFRVRSIPTLAVLENGKLMKAPEAGVKQVESEDGNDLVSFCEIK